MSEWLNLLPQWRIFTENNKPSHGEYMVLLKRTSEHPYLAIADYSYRNGGQWLCGDKAITNQVVAYQSPKILPEYMIEGD